MMTGAESVLCEMLSCGSMDLEMLNDVGYGWDDVLSQADWPQEVLGFNDIMRAVVDLGIIHVREALEEKIDELHGYRDEGVMTEDDKVELEAMEKLNPDEDIRSFHNCLDTHVWFEKNGDIYQQYLSEVLDEFAKNTGFEIG